MSWNASTYKVGDPVVFGSSGRFQPLIDKNLKGKILNIPTAARHIQFDFRLECNFSELSVWAIEGLDYLGESLMRFNVYLPQSTDTDSEDDRRTVRFQVAHASVDPSVPRSGVRLGLGGRH